jgi:biopolymer transport protein ExbD
VKSLKFIDKNNKEFSADMTPLIDVVFLLLLFFMVASSMDMITGMDIDLPKTDAKQDSKKRNNIRVVIEKNGNISINKNNIITSISIDMLEKEIKQESVLNNNMQISIAADNSIDYGLLVSVMEKIRNGGAANINFEVKKTE